MRLSANPSPCCHHPLSRRQSRRGRAWSGRRRALPNTREAFAWATSPLSDLCAGAARRCPCDALPQSAREISTVLTEQQWSVLYLENYSEVQDSAGGSTGSV